MTVQLLDISASVVVPIENVTVYVCMYVVNQFSWPDLT